MLSSQQALELRDSSLQQRAIQQRMASLEPQIKSAEQRLSLAGHQATLAESVMERYKKLAGTRYVSDIEYGSETFYDCRFIIVLRKKHCTYGAEN